MKPLNTWLGAVTTKAKRLIEDSDRRTFAAHRFLVLIRRVHVLATTSAHDVPEPTLERFQSEDSVGLLMEWHDKSSGWFLCVSVQRKLSEHPRVMLEFSGNPKSYATEKPTDDDIRQGLHDYFHSWKTEP